MNMSETLANRLANTAADPEWFRALPSKAVQQQFFKNVVHNAMWDFYVTPGGRVFCPLCAELVHAETVRLYEYLPQTNEFRLHFNLEDRVIQQEDAIRASKIHTSLTQINDGRLIMTTHTTARSPKHPAWMPQAYYTHPWEGFQGANILIYDPDTGVLENRGVPVPHESIYGATYDPTHNALYFSGYLRGHLYRFDLDTNRVTDYGKVTEYGSYCISRGPDQNLYIASRSGNLTRVNVQTQQLEELGITLPNNGRGDSIFRALGYTANWGDKMYCSCATNEQLWEYDPKNNTLIPLGDCRPHIGSARVIPGSTIPAGYSLWGMAFDDEGCLWYGCITSQLYLVRWDFLHGGKPENMGLLGTRERAILCIAEMYYRDGKLYISDTNHAADGPGVLVVDIKTLLECRAKGEYGPITGDALAYRWLLNRVETGNMDYEFPDPSQCKPLDEIYPCENLVEQVQAFDRAYEAENEDAVFKLNDPFFFDHPCTHLTIWREVGHTLSQVRRLWYEGDVLCARVGNENKQLLLKIQDGEIVSRQEIVPQSAELPAFLSEFTYPAYPGRRHRALPNACCQWNGGRTVVGTQEGMLAIVNEKGQVYSLGPAAANGPVNAMAANAQRTVLYGVAGGEHDLGNVFSYTDTEGLRWLGAAFRENAAEGTMVGANLLSAVALSPDEKTLAIGSADRMGVILLFHLDR